MQSRAPNVAAYLAERDPKTRAALTKVRALLRAHLPDAEEGMMFGMPGYTVGGVPAAAFAAQKNYLCLYICRAELIERHRAAFEGLSVGKGCIRFRAFDQLPMAAVKKILATVHARASGARSERRSAAAAS